MDRDDVIDDDELISIDLGAGVSRREVVKQLGAAGALVGTAAMAGCQSDSDATPTDGGGNNNNSGTPCPGGTPNGEGGSQNIVGASRHPAVAPPGWEPANTQEGSGDSDRTAVFVYQNSKNPFFVPMTCGFHDALNNYGWSGQAKAQPVNFGGQPPVQAAIIEREIDETLGAGDVLVTTILNSTTFNDPIQRALDNGIVVINGHTVPSPENWNKEFMMNEASGEDFSGGFSYNDQSMIIPHVGIRDERAGVSLAREAYARMQERNEKDEYSVLLCNALPNNPAVTRRVNKDATNQGTAQRYLETRSDPSVSIYSGGSENKILQIDPRVSGAETQISNTLGTDSVDAVLGSGYWAAVAAGNLKQNGDLSGDTIAAGFDLDQRMINGINDGGTTFTIAQDPYSQGYLNVPLAWIYLERGMEMKSIEWGVSVWDQDNIGFADERRNWDQLDTWQKNNYDFYG